MITNPKAIISEEATQSLEPRFKALSAFIDNHGGEDLIRYLHAQDVEVVTHSNGALLKCYRTKEASTEPPEECWRFWSGRYEVDLNHLDDSDSAGYGIGFSQNDLRLPIEYILDRTKEGKLDQIEPGTLIVVEVSVGEPDVRQHSMEPEGNMVVVGVKYEVSEEDIAELLSNAGDVEEQALKWSGRWESHIQVQKVADALGTDSIPLLFRGRLNATGQVITGMQKSAAEDKTFSQILNDFLGQAGDDPSEKDYERFFRHALRRFDDFEIRRLDKKGKIADATLVTKNAYKDLTDRLYRRYNDVKQEIGDTIDQYGKDSTEHENDYRDLSYLSMWVREKVAEALFSDQHEDPVTLAIHSLKDVKGQTDEQSVLAWVRRHLEEQGLPADLYREHIKDPNVPQARHMGRNGLWEIFMREVGKLIEPRLADLIADAT